MPPLSCLQQPDAVYRPLTRWRPPSSRDPETMRDQLARLAQKGWGGVVVAIERIQASQAHEADGFDLPLGLMIANQCETLGLGFWLDLTAWMPGGSLLQRWLVQHAHWRLVTLQLKEQFSVEAGQPVQRSLAPSMRKRRLFGITGEGAAHELNHLLGERSIEGNLPDAVERLLLFEAMAVSHCLNGFSSEATAAWIEQIEADFEQLFRSRFERITGVWLSFPYSAVSGLPWSEAVAPSFYANINFDAEAAETHRAQLFAQLGREWRNGFWLPLRRFLMGKGWPVLGEAGHRLKMAMDSWPSPPNQQANDCFQTEIEGVAPGVSMASAFMPLAEQFNQLGGAVLNGARSILVDTETGVFSSQDEAPDEGTLYEPQEAWRDQWCEAAARLLAGTDASERLIPALVLRACGENDSPLSDAEQPRPAIPNSATEIAERLGQQSYDCRIIDQVALERLQLDEEMLYQFEGSRFRFAVIVVPAGRLLCAETAGQLAALADEGGLIALLGDFPAVQQPAGERASLRDWVEDAMEELGSVRVLGEDWMNALLEWAPAEAHLKSEKAATLAYQRFAHAGWDAILIANPTDEHAEDVTVQCSRAGNTRLLADLAMGQWIEAPEPLVLQPGGHALLAFCDDEQAKESAPKRYANANGTAQPLDPPYEFFPRSMNAMPIFTWRITDEPIPGEPNARVHFRRCYQTTFIWEAHEGSLALAVYGPFGMLPLYLNGQRLFPRFRRSHITYDLTAALRDGENCLKLQLEKRLGSTDLNLLADLFFIGEFAVRQAEGTVHLGGMNCWAQSGSWTEQGYPYYSGVAVYRTCYAHRNDPRRGRVFLALPQGKEAAEVFVNGTRAGTLWNDPWRIEISPWVQEGDNLIEVHAANTLRNFVGRQPQPSGLLCGMHVEVEPCVSSDR